MEVDQDFIDFLKVTWKDNLASEAEESWKWKVSNFPHVAKRYLDSIERTLNAPPNNFIELAQEHGWIVLEEKNNQGKMTTKSLEDYLDWFSKMHEQFEAIYHELKPSED